MHAFGCVAYMYDNDPALRKLDNKSKKCRLLGYEGSNQYRLWNPKDRKVYRASWVRFDDVTTLSKEMGASTDDSWDFFSEFSNELSNDGDFFSQYSNDLSGETAVNSPVTTPEVEAIPEAGLGLSQGAEAEAETQLNTEDATQSNTEDATSDDEPEPVPQPRTSGRVRDRVNYRELAGHPKRGFALRASKAKLDSVPTVPKGVHEALNRPDKDKWHAAFTEELNNLTSSGTWELVPVPPGKKALPGRWVLAIKLDSMGVPDRYKARWVAKGFKQLEGLDYNETFSSVAKSLSWRILLALGAKYDWEIKHSDVVSAFLEAPLQEEVYVEQPHRYTNGNRNIACLLKRALYGLKQSSREWYNTLRAFFEGHGYMRLNKDHSVFVHENGTVVAIYVDDILMLAPKKSGISLLK